MDNCFLQSVNAYVVSHQEEIIEDLRNLVEIPSVALPGSEEPEPFGPDVAKVLEKALCIAEQKGMRTENCGNWYGLAKMGNGKHPIGIFSHLDVVEVDDRWIYPPYKLTIKDGWMIGRGSNDDKFAAVIGFHVAKAMKELNFGDHIELQLYLGCCEEKGMHDLEKYLTEQEEPEFSMVPDFIFPVSVSESGSARFSLTRKWNWKEFKDWNCGDASSRTPLHAEVIYTGAFGETVLSQASVVEYLTACWTEDGICIRTTGRNASGFGTNDAINATQVLLTFLESLSVLTEHDKENIASLREYALCTDGKLLNIMYADPFYGKLSCACFQITSQEDSCTLAYSARIPGNVEPARIEEKLRVFAEENDVQLNMERISKGSAMDPADDRVCLINEAWNEVTGKQDTPWAGGGTYAGKLKNAVAFGPKDWSVCEFLPKGHGDLHGPDEALSIRVAMDAIRTYILAFAKLDEWYRSADNN